MIGTVRLLTKASLLFLGITSLLICLAGAKAQNAASSTAQRYFSETFADPSASSSRWDQVTNGGTLLFSNGRVFLKGIGSGYPVIKTRQNPFPASGDFTFSFGYRFTSIGNYGTGLNCVGANGHIVADLHQDVNGQLLQVDDNISWQHPDTEWHVASFVMTGNRMSVYLDGSHAGDHDASTRPTGITIGGGTMSNPWDWNDLQIAFIRVDPGKQVFDKSALHLNDMPGAIAKTFPPLPHQISNVNVQDSDNALYCVMGDTVHLAGTTSGQHRLDRRSLTVNSQPYFDTPAGSNEDGYNFDWKPAAPGTYKIAVSFTLQKPYAVLSVKDVTVNVLPKAPLALQQFLEPVPASCPVAVQAADTSVFHPARVEFFLNDQSVGTATQAPFQVTLPISKQAPGSYKVSYQAYDAQGTRLNGESETVTVPVRVQLTMPAAVNLVAITDKTTFTSSIVPNLKIVRVDYSVDGQRVVSTTLPPYDASASLSAFKSGSHSVRSEVVVEDGGIFSNPPTILALTNQPDDARLARLAKEDADRQAAVQKEEEAKQARIAQQLLVAQMQKQAKIEQSLADTSTATLENTKQWICNAMDKSAGTLWRDGTFQFQYSGTYFDGNNLMYSSDWKLLLTVDIVIHYDYNVPLDKLDGSKVTVQKMNASSDRDTDSYTVNVSSFGDAPIISYKSRFIDNTSGDTPTKHYSVKGFFVAFKDQSTAERFAKAIRHAIRLCKANPIKEPF